MDCIVVGAGAAGIAAARRLRAGGASATVLEASGWLGGRARTIVREGLALDLGAAWLHSAERNPWVALSEAMGLTVERGDPGWDGQWRDLDFAPAARAEYQRAYAAFGAEVARLAAGHDRPLADALAVAGHWADAIDVEIGYVGGVAAAALSLHDYHAFALAASDNDWRVREGYGTAVARAADGLDVRLGVPVEAISLTRDGVRVECAAGSARAACAIITVSTSALPAIRFEADAATNLAAAVELPLGDAGKVFFAVEGAEELPVNGHLHGRPGLARSASHRLRPFGWPVIESYFGGPHAAELAAAGESATVAAMIDELAGLLGGSWRGRLRPLAVTGWRAEPRIGGVWSYARPGSRDARCRLARTVEGRLFFAGEACSADDVGTVHGAYATGVAAADAVLARLTPSGAPAQ